MMNAEDGGNDGDMEVIASLFGDTLELLAFEEKKEYLEAFKRCPKLVKLESDPLDFLKFEHYDVTKAAQRLMKYWKWRVDLFTDRAFLPLFDFNGCGACDEIDIKIIKTGFVVILPNDKDGDPVAFGDVRRANEFYNMSQEQANRLCFVLAEFARFRQKLQGRSRPHISILNLLDKMPTWLISNKSWGKLYEEALPTQLKWVRMIVVPKKKAQKTWYNAIFPILQRVILNKLAYTKAEVYCFDSKEEMRRELIGFGLHENCLPPSVGGTWSYENHNNWIQEKTNLPKTGGISEKRCKDCACKTEVTGITDGSGEEEITDELSEDRESINLDEDLLLPADAIQTLPVAERIALVKAKNDVPILLKKESPQRHFHRFNGCDSIQTIKHLAQHWKIRERLFSDRAFLHMNQLGSGALSKEDIKTFSSGFLMILPEDSYGHSVLVFDPSRSAACKFASMRRCLFYALFLLMDQSLSEQWKVQILILMTNAKAASIPEKKSFDDILKAFPVDITAFHVVLESAGLLDFEYKSNTTRRVESLFNAHPKNIVLHTVVWGMDICEELSIYGINNESIPSCIGGGWTDEAFLNWQGNLARYEAYHRSNLQVREQRSIDFLEEGLARVKTVCVEDHSVNHSENANACGHKRRQENGKNQMGSSISDGLLKPFGVRARLEADGRSVIRNLFNIDLKIKSSNERVSPQVLPSMEIPSDKKRPKVDCSQIGSHESLAKSDPNGLNNKHGRQQPCFAPRNSDSYIVKQMQSSQQNGNAGHEAIHDDSITNIDPYFLPSRNESKTANRDTCFLSNVNEAAVPKSKCDVRQGTFPLQTLQAGKSQAIDYSHLSHSYRASVADYWRTGHRAVQDISISNCDPYFLPSRNGSATGNGDTYFLSSQKEVATPNIKCDLRSFPLQPLQSGKSKATDYSVLSYSYRANIVDYWRTHINTQVGDEEE